MERSYCFTERGMQGKEGEVIEERVLDTNVDGVSLTIDANNKLLLKYHNDTLVACYYYNKAALNSSSIVVSRSSSSSILPS